MCHQIDRGQSSQGLVCPNSAGGCEHSLLYCSASACADAGTQRKEKKLLAAAGNGQAPLPTPPPRFQPQTPQQIPLSNSMVSIVANALDSLAQGFEQSAACAGLADSGTVATALQLALQMATNRLAARAHLKPTSAAGCEVGVVMDALIVEPAAQHATPAGQRAKPGSTVAISAAAAGNSGSACVGQPVAASTAAQRQAVALQPMRRNSNRHSRRCRRGNHLRRQLTRHYPTLPTLRRRCATLHMLPSRSPLLLLPLHFVLSLPWLPQSQCLPSEGETRLALAPTLTCSACLTALGA